MSRKRYQNPSVLERETPAGREYFVRYREMALELEDGQPVIKAKQKWHSLGLCAQMTKRQAEREKDKVLKGINAQVFNVQAQIKFSALLDMVLVNHVPTLAVPSQATYKQRIERYIRKSLGELRLCDVGPLQIEKMFLDLERDGLALSTRRGIKGVLVAVFGCAKRWEFLKESPLKRGLKIGGGPRSVRGCRVPSMEDLERLIGACEGDVPLLLQTLYYTGMRISEAAGLYVSDLDFDEELIQIRRRRCRGNLAQPKTEAGNRDVGMGRVAEKLRAHVQGKPSDEPVFLWDGKPICDNTLLANYLTPIMEDLGIKYPGFGFHTLRRMNLTAMGRKLSVFELRQQAGHADVRTTQKYIANDVEYRKEISKTLPAIGEIPSPENPPDAQHGLTLVKKAG